MEIAPTSSMYQMEEIKKVIADSVSSLQRIEAHLRKISKPEIFVMYKDFCRNIFAVQRSLQQIPCLCENIPRKKVIAVNKVHPDDKEFGEQVNSSITEIYERFKGIESLILNEKDLNRLELPLKKSRLILSLTIEQMQESSKKSRLSNVKKTNALRRISSKVEMPVSSAPFANFVDKRTSMDLLHYSFVDLIADEKGLALFRTFLKRELCEENLDFYLEVEQYKKIEDEQELSKRMELMKKKYIEMMAPREINLPGTLRYMILNTSEATPKIFDAALASVTELLKLDAFRRFMQTDDWKKWKPNHFF